jgi:hypothetical protein
MPKQIPPRTLNLLRESEKPLGAWDKIYIWVFSVGRYIIILVEIVVLVGFVARFSLDRHNNDLKESIDVKVDMLNAQRDVESELRRVQSTLATFSKLIDYQETMSTRMNKILDLIPQEMDLRSFTINQNRISLQLESPSYEVAQVFEGRLRSDEDYGEVKVSVESEGGGSAVLFTVTIDYAAEEQT